MNKIIFFIIGLSVYFIAEKLDIFHPIIFALLLGILVGNFYKMKPSFNSDVQYVGKYSLEWSIVFTAFAINYGIIFQLGLSTLIALILAMFLLLFLTRWLPNNPLYQQITFGTAICGSAAIATLAPFVDREKKNTGMAMGIVNFYGFIGMILLPYLLDFHHIFHDNSAYFLGGSLHSLGNVVGATAPMDAQIMQMAITIKLARIASLTFALFFILGIQKRNNQIENGVKWHLPWYIILFVIISIFVSVFSIPDDILKVFEWSSKILLTIAMIPIGMQIKFGTLVNSGKKGLFFGFLIFVTYFTLLLITKLFVKNFIV